ncbi:amidohydrolase family protein [Mycobacterium sp. E1747]|uniref:amidohydrolase family protein n=1 Tax=Mycobacterium sp. E1747 TaxID=1834128 RepID=UPI001E343B50|nr:amidohydrolase family protein [Mycobacterium sp. E1747]
MSLDKYFEEKVREYGRGASVSFIDEPDTEPLFCPIISVDDHALEPADLFENRLASKFADRMPRCVDQDDGAPWWIIDDVRVPIVMSNGASGRPISEWSLAACRFEEFRQGVWDPEARIRDMDLVGVWAQLCFGSIVWGFAGTRFAKMRDPELGLACLRAYNDWMLEEWCGAAPERYIPCQLPWLADPEIAAQEIRKNAARGFRSVSFSENPEGLGFPNIYNQSWDPFFRACEETGTVVNLHVGSSGKTQVPTTSSAEEVTVALFPVSGLEAVMDWVYSGVCLRFPELKIALSEAGVSWVPMALERLRRAYRQRDGIGHGWPNGEITPMELVHRNFYFTSIEDPSAFRLLDIIGEDHVMVETDYPHFDSTWPNCQAMVRGEMADLPAETVRKLCYENAARVYNHPLPPVELIARSEIAKTPDPEYATS